jgi:hypothetical protein
MEVAHTVHALTIIIKWSVQRREFDVLNASIGPKSAMLEMAVRNGGLRSRDEINQIHTRLDVLDTCGSKNLRALLNRGRKSPWNLERRNPLNCGPKKRKSEKTRKKT